jgi:hypothetical protein
MRQGNPMDVQSVLILFVPSCSPAIALLCKTVIISDLITVEENILAEGEKDKMK